MTYEQWQEQVPAIIKADSLWKMEAYRLAMFLADLAWHDMVKLRRDGCTFGVAAQLYEAVGSIGANLGEGYSRGSGKDRARFYEYSLGSTREARHWYYQSRHILGDEVFQHRLELLTQLIRLGLTMVPNQRQQRRPLQS